MNHHLNFLCSIDLEVEDTKGMVAPLENAPNEPTVKGLEI